MVGGVILAYISRRKEYSDLSPLARFHLWKVPQPSQTATEAEEQVFGLKTL